MKKTLLTGLTISGLGLLIAGSVVGLGLLLAGLVTMTPSDDSEDAGSQEDVSFFMYET